MCGNIFRRICRRLCAGSGVILLAPALLACRFCHSFQLDIGRVGYQFWLGLVSILGALGINFGWVFGIFGVVAWADFLSLDWLFVEGILVRQCFWRRGFEWLLGFGLRL